MRSANKLGAALGRPDDPEEAHRQVVQLKEMAGGEQREVAWTELPEALA